MSGVRHYAMLGLLVGLLVLLLVYPLVDVVLNALRGPTGGVSLAYLRIVLTGLRYQEGLINSLWIAVVVTGLVAAVSVPLAMLAVRYEFAGKSLVTGLLLVPLILPPFVGAIGLRHFFARYGGSVNLLLQQLHILSGNEFIDWLGEARVVGVIVLEVLHLYPIMYLNVVAALANIDPAMEEAGANLGASRGRVFGRITLPLMRPGLFAGGAIVFIWSFTELGTPLMMGYRDVTAVHIFEGIKEIGDSGEPYALVVVMTVVSLLMYVVLRSVAGRGEYAMMSKGITAGAGKRVRPLLAPAFALPFVALAAVAMIPHAGVLVTSLSGRWHATILPQVWTLDHYRNALEHGLTVPSITNSLRYSSLAMVVDVVVGVGIAYVVVRTRVWGRGLLDGLAMLPLAVPGLVLAFGYLSVTQGGWLSWLNPERGVLPLLVVAYAMRRLPYVVRSAAAGLQQVSVALEEAALNLGASRWRTMRQVTLPLIAANLLAGGLLAFSFAMLEVSDSLILAQRAGEYPITKAIYELSTRLGDGQYIASALGVWSMALLGAAILATSALLGRRMGAIFRI